MAAEQVYRVTKKSGRQAPEVYGSIAEVLGLYDVQEGVLGAVKFIDQT